EVTAPEDRNQGEIFRDVQPEDLLKYGLIPEFVGRLAVVASLEDLDEASLRRILAEPKNALVKHYQRLFEMEGVDLIVAEEALGAVVREAIDRRTGASRMASRASIRSAATKSGHCASCAGNFPIVAMCSRPSGAGRSPRTP